MVSKMKYLDINSRMPGNAGILSNLYPKPFIMDGHVFGSIEGFLQGLRAKDVEKQKIIFAKSGIAAKQSGYAHPIGKDQNLYLNGKPFNRHSGYYKTLLRTAFKHCFAQNDIFQKALYETRDRELIHTIGKTDPFETILTNDEFLEILNYLKFTHMHLLEKQYGQTTTPENIV